MFSYLVMRSYGIAGMDTRQLHIPCIYADITHFLAKKMAVPIKKRPFFLSLYGIADTILESAPRYFTLLTVRYAHIL